MTTLQNLLTELSESFELKTRNNNETFYCTKNNTNDDIVDLVRECHFDMLPNDTSYNLIVRVIDTLRDAAEHNNIKNIDELQDVTIDDSIDVYNSDLLKWVSSNLQRAEFVDEGMELFEGRDFWSNLSNGQYVELDAIKGNVISYLEEKLEERKNEMQ